MRFLRWVLLSRNCYVRTRVKFTCVNIIEAMYERSRVSVKVEPRSTFTFTPRENDLAHSLLVYSLYFIHCLFFIYARKHYVTVDIHP